MREKGAKFKLFISALEFYTGVCCDLLDKKAMVQVDKDSGVRDCTQAEIIDIGDLKPVLETILKTRTAAGTRMNTSKKSHSGSSRSHASLILTLH